MAKRSDPADRLLDQQVKDLKRAAGHDSPWLPAFGADRSGAPELSELARAELESRARFSPRRARWAEVQRLDAEVARLDQRRQQIRDALAEAHPEVARAPDLDAERLAGWLANGERGPRPAATAAAAAERVAELERERAAVDRLVVVALEEKTRYVERHRGRLVRVAEEHVEELRERARSLIDELAALRDDIADARAAEVWCRLFPDELAGRQVDVRPVAGALRKPLQAAGLTGSVEARQLFELLHADLDWLSQALTAEQKAKLSPPSTPDLRREAAWSDTSEGLEARREEVEREREAYRAAWGSEPSW
jgi:hypothetical protein